MLNDSFFQFGPGAIKFQDNIEPEEQDARIYLPVEVKGLEIMALLDTASPWSILQSDIAEAIGLDPDDGERSSIRTSRFGTLTGTLQKCDIVLASDQGLADSSTSLTVSATIWICRDWNGPNMIGYNTFLDCIRFAVDAQQQVFCFGPCE